MCGEITAGDPKELIATHLTVLSGVMVLTAYDEEYRVPPIDLLMRII